MITISWNSCETVLREMLRDLASRGDVRSYKLVDPLIYEMGTLAVAQALNCMADEFPEHSDDLATAIRHGVKHSERCKTYRNYYIHGINGITKYGIFFTDEDFEKDTPLNELMLEGPFVQLHQHTAKGKVKSAWKYLDKDRLLWFSNTLADLHEYLRALSCSVSFYLRSNMNFRESAPLPLPLPLPDVLAKTVLSHPKLKTPPALDLSDLPP